MNYIFPHRIPVVAVRDDGHGTTGWAEQLAGVLLKISQRKPTAFIIWAIAKLSRSNLSRINDGKPYALYEALFGKPLGRCQGVVPGHTFRFKNMLYSLDASTIYLCLSVFPWADFRTTKGAIKLHVGLNHAGCLPEFVTVTEEP